MNFSHIHSIQYPLALQVLNKCLELFLLHDPSSKRAQRATQSNNQSRNKKLNTNENSKKQPCNRDLVGLNPMSDVLSLIKTIKENEDEFYKKIFSSSLNIKKATY